MTDDRIAVQAGRELMACDLLAVLGPLGVRRAILSYREQHVLTREEIAAEPTSTAAGRLAEDLSAVLWRVHGQAV